MAVGPSVPCRGNFCETVVMEEFARIGPEALSIKATCRNEQVNMIAGC